MRDSEWWRGTRGRLGARAHWHKITRQLHARTTVAAGPFGRDQIWLNGVEEDIGNDRLQNVLRESELCEKQSWVTHSLAHCCFFFSLAQFVVA